MVFFQHFTYWFKYSTGQGCPWSALSKLSDHSGVGLEMPFLSFPHLRRSCPKRQVCVPGPHSTADAEVPTHQPEPAPRKLFPPSLHFSRCLESILFCSHSAPGPNPFQYWLWATIYNEIQMSVTYGKSDSH